MIPPTSGGLTCTDRGVAGLQGRTEPSPSITSASGDCPVFLGGSSVHASRHHCDELPAIDAQHRHAARVFPAGGSHTHGAKCSSAQEASLLRGEHDRHTDHFSFGSVTSALDPVRSDCAERNLNCFAIAPGEA